MAASALPNKRRNKHRDYNRNRMYLKKICYICLQTQYRWTSGGEGIREVGGIDKLESENIPKESAQVLESIAVPCCDKFFHECCLTKWFQNNFTCPMCRAKLAPCLVGTVTSDKSALFLRAHCLSSDQVGLARSWSRRLQNHNYNYWEPDAYDVDPPPENHNYNYWDPDGYDIDPPQLTPPPGWVQFRRSQINSIGNPRPGVQHNFHPG